MSLTPWDSEVLCEQKGWDFCMEMGGFTLRMKTPCLSSIPRKALVGTQSAISLLLCTNAL